MQRIKIHNTHKATIVALLATLVSGCVSDADFAALNSQVNTLTAKNNSLQNELTTVKKELAAVKEQRVVRLPTGAPTQTKARSTTPPAYTQSEDERLFNEAVKTYRSGDVQTAVQQLEQFNSRYPNAKQHTQVLFYLGQANYTMRDYNRAQQVLEELVYQTPPNSLSNKAANLLLRVYQAQNNSAKVNELNSFIQYQQVPQTQQAPQVQQVSPSAVQ